MLSEIPRFAFIYRGKWWSVDFKLGKGLKYLTGVMSYIFLLCPLFGLPGLNIFSLNFSDFFSFFLSICSFLSFLPPP